MQIHHVQLSMPPGRESEARRFYGTGLGLTEVAKPDAHAGRGGCWFRGYDGADVSVELHLGVDVGFTAAAKAHPALLLDTVTDLEDLGERLVAAGEQVSWAERTTFDGYERFHCRDPFGNRIEVMAPVA